MQIALIYSNFTLYNRCMTFYQQENLKQNLLSYKSIGLVPTMGALHQGHLSLVKKAISENDVVVVSVFVNPTQFDNDEDLIKYPRTLNEDIQLVSTLKGTVFIYVPQPDDLYGKQIKSKKYSFGGLEHQMEGRFRTGHFDGVGTVVNLLIRAVGAHKAYFGEKDFQQLQIVKKLIEVEKLNTQIVGCLILREPNGLAMSSRNKRLSKQQFEEAKIIYKSLKRVREDFNKKSISQLRQMVNDMFKQSDYLQLEYFEIADVKNLKTAQRKRKNNTYRAFIAAFAGEVRLIDNLPLN